MKLATLLRESKFLGETYQIKKEAAEQFYFETFGYISKSDFTTGLAAEKAAWIYIMSKRKK